MVPAFIFFHNTATCIGCCACQTACKDKNNLQPGEFFRHVLSIVPKGTEKARFLSLSCSHCQNPACVAACPNGAFYQAEDGTVLHDDGLCIGCGRCVWNCPFGEVTLSKERGLAQKCNGCLDLQKQGKEPACVAACVNRSLQFGKTDGRCREEDTTPTLHGTLPEQTGPRIRLHDGEELRP